jgi:hypothetical protein
MCHVYSCCGSLIKFRFYFVCFQLTITFINYFILSPPGATATKSDQKSIKAFQPLNGNKRHGVMSVSQKKG